MTVMTDTSTTAATAVFPYPVAVCDIGGTNVRLAEIVAPGSDLKIVARIGTGAHDTLAQAIASCHDSFASPPRSLIVCAAGPVDGRSVKLTNARWTIDGPQVAAALGLDQGLLLNDFEAQAIMLPSLRPEHVLAIGEQAAPASGGTRLVLGPGTGLGAGLLVPAQGALMPLMTEAGHMDFGATSPFDVAVWAIVRRDFGRVTGESLLSGPGTVRLYRAICELEGVAPATDDPATITDRAFADRESIEARTLRAFWILVARFAGSLALGFLAKGGVTLSGGILKRIVDFLDPGAFRHAFEDQAPLQALVAKIPVRLVTDDSSVLEGLAALAADPDRFGIAYRERLWRV